MNNIHNEIAIASKALMWKEPFYALFLMTLNKVISEEVPTAGVSKNGINCQLIINEEYWSKLKKEQHIGLLKHELLHIVFFHLTMRDSFQDHILFNIAADCEVNQYIEVGNLPPNPILPEKFPELNLKLKAGTKYYYDKLRESKKQGNCASLIKLITQQEVEGDSHKTWNQFEEISEAEKRLMEKQLDYQIKELVNNNYKDRHTLPAELKSYIDKLFTITEPVIDWKSYLRRFIGASHKIFTRKSRRKVNKRFYGLPAIKIKVKNHILVAVDTSGSVSDRDLKDFFHEIYHMWKSGVVITVLQCDAKIDDISEFTGKFDGRITGRGGTNFEEPIKYLNEYRKKYSTLIYLTDMYAPVPTTIPCKQMMWCVSKGGAELSTLGKFPGTKVKIQG